MRWLPSTMLDLDEERDDSALRCANERPSAAAVPGGVEDVDDGVAAGTAGSLESGLEDTLAAEPEGDKLAPLEFAGRCSILRYRCGDVWRTDWV